MARTNVTTTRLSPGDAASDVAESTVAVDAANGMRVVISVKARHLLARISNTHASTHAVTISSAGMATPGNSRAIYTGAGPSGSNPSEPDYVSAAIAATTGVRWLALPMRYVRPDNSIWLNFEALHTGTIAVVEWS